MTSDQTIVVPLDVPKNVLTQKMWQCDQPAVSRKNLLDGAKMEICLASNIGPVGFEAGDVPVNLTLQLTRRR